MIERLRNELRALLDTDPTSAVERARAIRLDVPDRVSAVSLRAAILIDGGAECGDRDAIEEGTLLFRALYAERPESDVAYNLANGLNAMLGQPPSGAGWLNHHEATRTHRAEARRLYWSVARDESSNKDLRTQAWTNLGALLTRTYRLGEAHDARLAALVLDPTNGAAAGCAARDLIWLFEQGGCSDLTRVEAILLAKVAKTHRERTVAFVGKRAADELAALADQLGDAPPRTPHTDAFVRWVERERLTLAPAVELVDPSLGKLDWLMLPGILERDPVAAAAALPPIFAIFNVLKADFILARELAWRSLQEEAWARTGRFADTLDYAVYGPNASALVLAHRTAVDLLDKIGVAANFYFELGFAADRIHFGQMWRSKKTQQLHPTVSHAIEAGAFALYGLVELAEDYFDADGIHRPHKDLRNAGTHRFVVLHDLGKPAGCRESAEVDHHARETVVEDVVRALRVARSALQMLVLGITQREHRLVAEADGVIGTLAVPDHDWVRGEREPR